MGGLVIILLTIKTGLTKKNIITDMKHPTNQRVVNCNETKKAHNYLILQVYGPLFFDGFDTLIENTNDLWYD